MQGESRPKKRGHVLYRLILLVTTLLHYAAVALIIVFLVPLVVSHMKDAGTYPVVKMILEAERTISDFVKGIIPTVFSGQDITRWIVIGAAFVFIAKLSSTGNRYRNKVVNLKVQNDYEDLKAQMKLSDDSGVLAPLREQLDELQSASGGKERERLLKLFATTKKKLDSMGRDLAFLAIDVVDSTGLKQGEEKPIVEHDFMEFKKFVDGKLSSHGALKSAWTPDGAMVCFANVDAAVRAARDVIKGLGPFNSHVKTMKGDFQLRCGINSGFVHFHDSMPMEEMSDRVIDIAGHMQKYAEPNTICIAKPAIEPTEERSGFVPASRVVDGYEVYRWEAPDAETG